MRMLAPLLVLAAIGCRTDTEIEPVDHDGDGVFADEDCNDDDAAVFPGAEETCNGIDDDCDGEIDEDAVDATTFFLDRDADGYGDPDAAVEACDAPDTYVTNADDCDDTSADFHPGADESDCTDPNDYNCDGSVGFADADGDGFPACEDCDDSIAAINPAAVEACDGIDNDCDGAIDEPGATGESTWHADADGDGYGHPSELVRACDQPEGYVADNTDCNDDSDQAHPGGVEVCDGLDNDCNGERDEPAAIDATTWYADGDADGYGRSGLSQRACYAPEGFVSEQGDCDDERDDVYPGATEVCDERDNDCNGIVDEGFDLDGDGVTSCGGDCDDDRADVKPGAPELCDDVDNDCDGAIDEAAVDAPTWYIDYDADGYGDSRITQTACDQPSGFAATDDDCDDLSAAFNPGAAEGCDGQDYNCDGAVDNDGDGDGYADASCGGSDCDDTDDGVNPGATEIDYDGVDNDCDPSTLDDDLDQDGFVLADDCDDTDPTINPAAEEIWYDGIDQDCDAASDYDQDGDGHDAVEHGGDDCDDTNADVWEICEVETGTVETAISMSASSLSWTHAVSGNARLLMVAVAEATSLGRNVTSVTYQGSALTLIGHNNNSNHGHDMSLWMLVNPPTGSGQVQVSLNTAQQIVAGSMLFTGVDQSDPIGTVVTGTTSGSHAASFTLNVPSSENETVLNVASTYDPISASAGHDVLYIGRTSTGTSRLNSGAATKPGVNGSVPMTWTVSPSESWASVGVSIRPGGN